ncbi:MAG TPA: malectin domain-containing carbohydrate-binding protein [Phycisphaerae bacterium]|jgi:hypothetical protein
MARHFLAALFLAMTLMIASCQTPAASPTTQAKLATPATVPTVPAAPRPTIPPALSSTTLTPAPTPAMAATIRIKAGRTTPFKDSAGNTWMPDTGFADGETTDRDANLAIAKTKDPELFRSEHYSMTAFSYPVPNGKYTVNLYFAETYTEGVTMAGERVFSMNVEGKDIVGFDPTAKAGAVLTAYMETVQVTVADGKLDITFTASVQNPEINAIEIIPAK